MKRKIPVLERAAWLYRNMIYVKSWGRLPITHIRPVHVRTRNKTQRVVLDPREPAPRGWTRGFQVRTAEGRSDFVEADDLVVPRLPKGTTQARFDSHCPHKLQRNLDWLGLCLKYPRDGRRHAIVLDGISLKTSVLSGWANAFETLHVPNWDAAFPQSLNVPKPDNVRIYPGSLYEFLLTQDHPAPYDCALDYCASFGGNQSLVLPQADLTYLLSHGLLARTNGVLWLTFSTRYKGGGANTLDQVKVFMQTLAKETHYTLELCSSGSYFNTDAKGAMVYLFYRSK